MSETRELIQFQFNRAIINPTITRLTKHTTTTMAH